MFNRLTAFLLLVIFMSQLFSNSLITVSFHINQNYIAKNLCENRDNPMMHCNGKCQLKKKIEQESKKDQENPERKSDNKNELTVSAKSYFPAVPKEFTVAGITKNIFPQTLGSITDRSFDFFHLPQA